MTTESLFFLFGGILGLLLFLLWIRTLITRSFEPVYGEEYIIMLFGFPVLTVKTASPTARWHQKWPYYLVAWPFKVASFIYEWVQEMTYEEYLHKKEFARTKKDYDVSIVWQPKYKDVELLPDGTPKDKTVTILVSRKEKLKSLRQIEGFTLASEFETSDGYRGWRIFTLLLEIQDLKEIISRFRQWQRPAVLTFKGEYNSWSKTVDYVTLRKTTMNQLNVNLGRSAAEPFINEINEKTKEFGYIVNSIKEGEVYLAAETMDMIELQEEPKKAQLRSEAAKFEALTTTTKAQAEANAITIKATGEANAIAKIEGAKTKVIEERTKIAIKAFEKLSAQQVLQLTAKYGSEGIGKLTGTYVEAGNDGGTNRIDVQELIQDILALKVAVNTGGAS